MQLHRIQTSTLQYALGQVEFTSNISVAKKEMFCVGTEQIDIKHGCCKEINKHKKEFASNMLVAKKEKNTNSSL
jgi:hypothetical protein